MKNWFYYSDENEIKEIQSVDDFEKDCFGFIYKITNITNNKIYIGKKYLFHTTKKKYTLAEKAENKKINIWKEYKYVVKESDWKKYYGSNKKLIEDIKILGYENFDREIIKFCYDKRSLTYWETSYQFKYDVLLTESYNDNISGRYYREDFNLDKKD